MSAPRCKPGDLALVIKGRQTGKTVKVIAPAPDEEVIEAIRIVMGVKFKSVIDQGQLWRIDLPITWSNMADPNSGCMVAYAPDNNLVPITPGDEVKHEDKVEELVE